VLSFIDNYFYHPNHNICTDPTKNYPESWLHFPCESMWSNSWRQGNPFWMHGKEIQIPIHCYPFFPIRWRNPIKVWTKWNSNYIYIFWSLFHPTWQEILWSKWIQGRSKSMQKIGSPIIHPPLDSKWLLRNDPLMGNVATSVYNCYPNGVKKEKKETNIRTILNMWVQSGKGQSLASLLYMNIKLTTERIHTCLAHYRFL